MSETLLLFQRLNSYAGKYQINMQLWGLDNNQIFISKDDVNLWDCGNEKTPEDAMKKAVDYLDRINNMGRLTDKDAKAIKELRKLNAI